MQLKALMKLTLHDAETNQRGIFIAEMENLKWKKADDLGTTWNAGFNEGVKPDSAIKNALNTVIKAAAEAKIKKYDGEVQAGNVQKKFNQDGEK